MLAIYFPTYAAVRILIKGYIFDQNMANIDLVKLLNDNHFLCSKVLTGFDLDQTLSQSNLVQSFCCR